MHSTRQVAIGRLILGVCVIVGVSYVVGASLTFVISPILADLQLSADDGALALAIPAIGSLLIVFLVGRAADRIGHRRVIIFGSVPFLVGGLLVASATSAVMLTVGLLLAGAAATGIQIAALGQLQSAVPEGQERIRAFTSFGMVFPFIYLIVPVATGWSVVVVSWRFVPLMWVLLGLFIPLLALRTLPSRRSRQPLGEVATPLLAGLLLAAVVQTLDRGSDQGWTAPLTVIGLVISVLSASVLITLLRRLPMPSLDVHALGRLILVLLLVVVALLGMVVTLTYVTLALQYIFGVSVLGAALLLLPAQVTSVIGAKVVAGQLMTRYGSVKAGQITMIGLVASFLALAAFFTGGSPVVLVACASVVTLCGFAAVTIVNAEVMGQAQSGQAGMVAASRGAASALGSSLSLVILGSIISTAIAAVSVTPDDPVGDPDALVVGLRVFGVTGALVSVMAWGLLTGAARLRPSRVTSRH